MTNTNQMIEEHELHAYLDGQLDPARHAEVEAFLAEHPAEATRVEAYRRQNDMMRAMFDPVMAEPIPLEMKGSKRPRTLMPMFRYAAVAAWVVLGGVVGWVLHGTQAEAPRYLVSLPQQAAMAHVVYTPEVAHPVEVGADQEAHLVKWLSKRLGAQMKAPHLADAGYQLMGGRLLPGESGPAAQFMYNNDSGQRLTLYVRTQVKDNHETTFRFEQEGKVGVFYWVNGPVGYALSGELSKPDLLTVATAVYHQLETKTQ